MNVTVSNTTLFHVASAQLGDATQWDRIARLNGLDDPLVVGTMSLQIPVRASIPTAPVADPSAAPTAG